MTPHLRGPKPAPHHWTSSRGRHPEKPHTIRVTLFISNCRTVDKSMPVFRKIATTPWQTPYCFKSLIVSVFTIIYWVHLHVRKWQHGLLALLPLVNKGRRLWACYVALSHPVHPWPHCQTRKRAIHPPSQPGRRWLLWDQSRTDREMSEEPNMRLSSLGVFVVVLMSFCFHLSSPSVWGVPPPPARIDKESKPFWPRRPRTAVNELRPSANRSRG